MRKTREILRLKYEAGLSHRVIAQSLGIANSTVPDACGRLKLAGLTWEEASALSDTRLEERLYRNPLEPVADPREPDWARVRGELGGHRHVTLQLLWQEYREEHPDGYGCSWFCERCREWLKTVDVVMRQEHTPGEKLFADWAGDMMPVIDPETGGTRPAYLFVAVLGASSYLYAEAALSQDTAAFLGAHCRAFEFLGGVPGLVVCGNLKTGVKRPDRHEPDIHAPYADLAARYGAAILPARVRKPRDKAKVEAGVLMACRQIMAPLRHKTFFSLSELNSAIAALVEKINARPFKKLPGSRQSVFLERERECLRPLPAEPYLYRTRKTATVSIDYHVELTGRLYSVPWHLARQKVELVFDGNTVEIIRASAPPCTRAR